MRLRNVSRAHRSLSRYPLVEEVERLLVPEAEVVPAVEVRDEPRCVPGGAARQLAFLHEEMPAYCKSCDCDLQLPARAMQASRTTVYDAYEGDERTFRERQWGMREAKLLDVI